MYDYVVFSYDFTATILPIGFLTDIKALILHSNNFSSKKQHLFGSLNWHHWSVQYWLSNWSSNSLIHCKVCWERVSVIWTTSGYSLKTLLTRSWWHLTYSPAETLPWGQRPPKFSDHQRCKNRQIRFFKFPHEFTSVTWSKGRMTLRV